MARILLAPFGMDAIELLQTQHAEVDALFEKLEHASDDGERRDLVGRLVDRLTMHAALEEEYFYPALEEIREGAPMAAQARDDHRTIKAQLEALRDPEAAAAEIDLAVRELRRTVQQHVAEEEGEMMPQARRLGAGRLRDLARKMEARIQVGEVEYQKVAGARA